MGGLKGVASVWAALVPLFQPWVAARAPRKIHLAALPITPTDLAKLGATTGRVSLVLPSSACLMRDISLPKAARQKAAQAISMNLRGSLPAGGKGLVWVHAPIGDAGDKAVFRCAIVKETHLQQLRDIAASAGAKLADIRLRDFPMPEDREVALWQAVPKLPATAKNWAVGTALVVIMLALAVIVLTEVQIAQVSEQVAVRSAHVAQLEQRLAEAEAQEARGTADAVLMAAQIADFQNGLRPLAGLGRIAASLPPDVWLSELSVASAGWRLSGFAGGEVTQIVTALQAVPGAENVRLSGPVMFDTYSQKSRFDIELTLRPDGAP